jgi:hypothetical protein
VLCLLLLILYLFPSIVSKAIVQRCSGLARGLAQKCSLPNNGCSVRVVSVFVSPDIIDAALQTEFSNTTLDGIVIVGAALSQRAPPFIRAYHFLGRRVATFDVLDDATYSLLDDQLLFFAVDSQPWLQGFLSVVLGSYLVQTGQALDASAGGSFIKTGPTFIGARGFASKTAKPTVRQARFDVISHAGSSSFWETFRAGVAQAASQLGLSFRDCYADTSDQCATSQLGTARFYAPAVTLDVATQANFLNKAGQRGTDGVVTTLVSLPVKVEKLQPAI